VSVGVTGRRTQRPRAQVGPPGAHPAHPSPPLDPGTQGAKGGQYFAQLAWLITQPLTRQRTAGSRAPSGSSAQQQCMQ
jgi:hypothetical protein